MTYFWLLKAIYKLLQLFFFFFSFFFLWVGKLMKIFWINPVGWIEVVGRYKGLTWTNEDCCHGILLLVFLMHLFSAVPANQKQLCCRALYMWFSFLFVGFFIFIFIFYFLFLFFMNNKIDFSCYFAIKIKFKDGGKGR